MILHVPAVLTREEVTRIRKLLASSHWADGRITAGTQSEQTKRNYQLPEDTPAAREAQAIVLPALEKNALLFAAALPKRIFPPLFNCYTGEANSFGDHIDNAVRTIRGTAERMRTDLSATLFLSDPGEYDGGDLVIDTPNEGRRVKLPAGDLILYPSSTVHRVEKVTRGARIASFFWIESMVRDDSERRVLFDLDMAVLDLRSTVGDIDPVVRLTGCYHNLLRRWAHT